MGRCTDPLSRPAAFSTNAEGLEITQNDNSVLVTSGIDLESSAWVSSAMAQAVVDAQLFEWVIAEVTHPISVGLVVGADDNDVGEDIINCLYTSDGRLIVDGAVVRTTAPFAAGSTVSLYVDPDSATIVWFLDGVAV